MAANYGVLWFKIGEDSKIILIAIGGLVGAGLSRQKRGAAVPPALFWLVGILTATNAAIAVLWR